MKPKTCQVRVKSSKVFDLPLLPGTLLVHYLSNDSVPKRSKTVFTY